jgi:anionic cell wall polymer biosynthesis LytR-Cps2A-Psr (LCP) family protein
MQTDKIHCSNDFDGILKRNKSSNWSNLFWLKHDRLSNVKRFGFWMLSIAFTAIVSSIFGAILTLIPAVDRATISILKSSAIISNDKLPISRSIVYPPLTRSVNLLFMEIEPKMWAENNGRTTFAGSSRRIWLWQFQPQKTSVTVISIPNDSKVQIPGIGWRTIDDANFYGGTALVSQTLGQIIGVPIDRYLRATPKAIEELTKAILHKQNLCQNSLKSNCDNSRTPQQLLTVAHQNFKHTQSIEKFTEVLTDLKPQIDTNLSRMEMLSLTGFILEVKEKQFNLNLLPGYTPVSTEIDRKTPVLNFKTSKYNHLARPKTETELFLDSTDTSAYHEEYNPFRHQKIVVQNTTDNPELAMKVLAYLAKYNFQNVSSIDHLPLQLQETKLVTQNNIQAASYLQQILGMGKLELATKNHGGELIIRIGEDIESLTLEESFVR